MPRKTSKQKIPPEECCCAFCAFWNRFDAVGYVAVGEKPKTRGECHRSPPQVNGHLIEFPRTYGTTWCGEFRHITKGDKFFESNKLAQNQIEEV